MRLGFPTTALPLLTLASMVVAQPALPPHRRHHQYRSLAERAGAVIPNDTLASISAFEASEAALTQTSTAVVINTPSTSSVIPTSTPGTTPPALVPSSSPSSSLTSSTPGTTSSTNDGLLGVNVGFSSVIPSSSSSGSTSSSAVPTTSSPMSSATPTSSEPPSIEYITHTSVVPSVVSTSASSHSASASVAAAKSSSSSEKIGGLPKTTFIIIIAVAGALVLVALAWTAFRKWKLKPSRGFDSRMKPVDFSPGNDGLGDDFLEKALKRSLSRDSLNRQRQQFVSELDESPTYVEGVPEHDFTAGAGAYQQDMYNTDPFAHANAYEYGDPTAYYHGYPPQGADYDHDQTQQMQHDYPTQDPGQEEYANLQRGSSGSSHGSHGREVAPSDFPMPNQYIGRPTEGDGPYAQAAQYRAY